MKDRSNQRRKSVKAVRTGRVRAVHTKVAGRARFHVQGLRGSEALKRHLEDRLAGPKEILGFSASAVTGNVLVFFQAGVGHGAVSVLIEAVLAEDRPVQNGKKRRPEPKASNPSSDALPKRMAPLISSGVHAAQGLITRILPAAFEEQKPAPWHLMEVPAVVDSVQTEKDLGLSEESAGDRLKRYGPNLLAEPKSRSRWEIFRNQFISLPVALLGAAAGISLLTGGLLDAVVISGVVFANAVIGYLTESEAEKTIQSLRHFVRPAAEVLRGGQVCEIPGEEVVPGDILMLRSGTYVAADARILEAAHLTIDESVLTGESLPVTKHPKPLSSENVALADRTNMGYMGTLVTGGQGTAVVVATGGATEVGRLQALLDETTSPQTPIERQLRHTGDQLVVVCGAVCGIVFLIGFIRGYGFLQMIRMSISLAASAVPEGLPAAATINFALGIRNMRKHHVLLRHLQAVETLGAVQTVCLDKTGTITENRMTVLRVFAGDRSFYVDRGRFLVEGAPVEPLRHKAFARLADACVLCNEAKVNGWGDASAFALNGTPTECALMELAAASGIDVLKLRESHRVVKINLRSENRLFMSTLHQGPGSRRIFSMKGSPTEVLGLCRWQHRDGRLVPLTEEDRLRIETENQRMAGDALRVLGVAHKPVDGTAGSELEEDLIWLGLVGMADPVRKGVRELIDVYHRAGIETVMITGDQGATAYAVAQQLNLSQGNPLEILDSSQLTAIDPPVLQALAQKVKVYSRVSPAHKLRIVQALQASGKVVAMTGDGINDGPALKAADIGIAMGRSGTDLARDVADVVLEDDRLETLIIAVRDGRTTYNNIRKSVHFFLSTNLTEIMVMFAAMSAGLGFPLNVMQLLWINIISDIFPGLALSMEAPEPDVLDQPPRDPRAPLLSRRDFAGMARESAVISASSLGAYGYGILRYGMGAKAGSIAFQSLTMAQILHALSCRSERHSVFGAVRPPPNRYLTLALGGSIALQILTLFVPGLRGILGLAPLGAGDLLVVGGSAVLPFVINEALKGVSKTNEGATA